jgi:hypothetical protein
VNKTTERCHAEVADVVRIEDNRYRFTAVLECWNEGRVILRDCTLVGPTKYGDFLVFGPSRFDAGRGRLRELVSLPLLLRQRLQVLAQEQRDVERRSMGGAS